jgi:phosphate transport system permease protein
VILALSRAIGETAPLIVIGAAVSPRFNPDGLMSSFTALPMQIFGFSKDTDARFLELAAAAIIVLMAVLLVMNSVAIVLRNRYAQKW